MLRCRSCGKEFDVKEVADSMSQKLEEELGGFRSDRV